MKFGIFPTIALISITAIPAQAEVTLDPTLHLTGVTGYSSAESIEDLALHGHDPNKETALQGLDVGLNLRVDNWFAAFANVNTFTDAEGEFDAEWEEGFIKFMEISGGFEIRAGRFLNRFGLQNNVHLHRWDFVNSNLSTATFLGEDGLRTDGVELMWKKDFDLGFFSLNGSFGRAVSDDHGHGEEEEEHDDDDEEEEGHDDEEEEEFALENDVVTVRALIGYNQTDFHQHRFGVNFGRDSDSQLYSADYQYTWRANGLETGGQEFTIGAEYFHLDDTSEDGLMIFGSYRFNDPTVLHVRYEDYEHRDRFSAALTHRFDLNELSNVHVRLQYQHDKLEDRTDDSVFLQFGFHFGDGEVR